MSSSQTPATGAPISRIVWSLQAGVVLFTLGLGLWLVQNRVMDQVAAGFAVTGTIVMTVGVGFVVSAVIALRRICSSGSPVPGGVIARCQLSR